MSVIKKWNGCCRYFICVHADRGLIAAPWTPLAFPCVPFDAGHVKDSYLPGRLQTIAANLSNFLARFRLSPQLVFFDQRVEDR